MMDGRMLIYNREELLLYLNYVPEKVLIGGIAPLVKLPTSTEL